jgi:lipopolysaccharide export system protein LptA
VPVITRNKTAFGLLLLLPLPILVLVSAPLAALVSDRQQTLLVNADNSDGTFGDGTSVLRGNVEIRQGTLLVQADQAEVVKAEGKVVEVLLSGQPALLQQEIENEGLVTATAASITYKVATGIVTLTGNADVDHPQYKISGELLVYDMNLQHFQGSGGDNGRIRIELEPEVINQADGPTANAAGASSPDDLAPGATPEAGADNPAEANPEAPEAAADSGSDAAD